jgi:hypothetical protein
MNNDNQQTSEDVKNLMDVLQNLSTDNTRQCNIRLDKQSQNISVIDVIRLITGQDSCHAGQTLTRLGQNLVDSKSISRIRINGNGRLSPVVDVSTMMSIIGALPGKRVKVIQGRLNQRAWRSINAWKDLIMTGSTSLTENGVEVSVKNAIVEIKEPESEDSITKQELIERFFSIDVSSDDCDIKQGESGYVYFIRMTENYTKVGMTGDIDKRMSNLQTGSPFPLKLIRSCKTTSPRVVERLLHYMLTKQNKHIRGEWFNISDGEIDELCTMISEYTE